MVIILSMRSMLDGESDEDKVFQSIVKGLMPKATQFFTASGKKPFSGQYQIKVPNDLNSSHLSSVVGTGFDYLIRLIVARHINADPARVLSRIAAQDGLSIIKRFVDASLFKRLDKKYSIGLGTMNGFIRSTNSDIEPMLPFIGYFARLEMVARSGMPPIDIEASLVHSEPAEVVNDLRQLVQVFTDDFILSGLVKPTSEVVFNPSFGILSMCCRGADSDLFVDGTLYDLKTTKQNGFKWRDAAQLTGYYLLSEAAERTDDFSTKIFGSQVKRIALYKARFGEIEYFDLEQIDCEALNMSVNNLLVLFGLS